jgi:hypothetical protein
MFRYEVQAGEQRQRRTLQIRDVAQSELSQSGIILILRAHSHVMYEDEA